MVPTDYSTIQSAIDASQKGDTVLVSPGDYHEFLAMKDSIVVMSVGNDDGGFIRALGTKIHSEGLRDSENNIPPVVNMADGAVLDGFEITGMDTVNHHLAGHSHAVQNRGTSGTVMNCIVHDNGSTGIGSHEKDGKPAIPTIIHNIVYRNFGIGIGFNHFASGIAKDNIVYENRETGIGIQNGATPVIDNNIVYRNGWDGIASREGAFPIVRNNEIYSNGIDPTGEGVPEGAGVGIGADSTGWTVKEGQGFGKMIIRGNKVFDNPSGGIMCRNKAQVNIELNVTYDNNNFQIAINDSSNAQIDSNMVYNTAESNYNGGGIVVNRGSQAVIIKNNISNSNIAGIIISDGSIANIFANYVYTNKQSGIRIIDNKRTINISGNNIFANGSLGIMLNGSVANIDRNLLEFNNNGAISVDDTSSAHIYNNTIYAEGVTDGRGIFAGSNDTKIMNNIVVGYQLGIFKQGNPEIDYNCTFSNQGYNGPPGIGGQNAIAEDPLFVFPDTANYYLQENSPCIDKGNPDSFYNDFDGSRSDIGCFPYYSTSSFKSKIYYNSIIIYPTLANEVINVNISGTDAYKNYGIIEIYNLLGEKIQTFNINQDIFRINILGLKSGLYYLNYRFGEKIGNAKFMKID